MRRLVLVWLAAGAALAQQPNPQLLEQAQQRLQQAQEAIARQDSDQALKLLDEALALAEQAAMPMPEPRQGIERQVMVTRGAVLLAAGRLDEAETTFEAYLEQHADEPELPAALAGLARIAEKRDDAATAESWRARLIDECPQSMERYQYESERFMAALQAGQTDAAQAIAESLVADWPANPEALWMLAGVAEQRRGQGDQAAAVALYERLQADWPQTRHARMMRRPLADGLVALGRLDEAKTLIAEIRADAPELEVVAELARIEADLLRREQDWRGAADVYDRLAADYPGTYAAYEAMLRQADLFLEAGDVRAAGEVAEQMVAEFEPVYFRAPALAMLIRANLDPRGNLAVAQQAAGELLELSPGDVNGGWPLLQCCYRLFEQGEQTAAKELAGRIAEAYTGPPIGLSAQRLMEQWEQAEGR